MKRFNSKDHYAKLIVVDLDGTLCDSSHRDHLAQAGQWDDFHRQLENDKVHEDVAMVLHMAKESGLDVIAITGRSQRYYNATLDWLSENGLGSLITSVYMRPDGNYDSDTVVKLDLMKDAFGSLELARSSVLFILDDRDKVVEMWRNAGFRCWQVQPGGY